MMILLFFLLAIAQDNGDFVCNPPKEIKDRVNEYCIQASQFAITYTKPQTIKIKNGKLFYTSEETDDGSVVLKMAHQCHGQKTSAWKRFEKFCGYENVDFDRTTPAILQIRQELAQVNRLNEKNHRNQIDRLIAQQMNPWLADPKNNISETNGKVKIKTLKNRLDITCHTSEELTYETNCK
jgi:hypothetical protein